MRNTKVIFLVAVLCLIANMASASMIVDMIAVANSGSGAITNGGKTVSGLLVGDTVSFEVYATVTKELTSELDGYFVSAQGKIAETATALKSSGNGVHGDLNWTNYDQPYYAGGTGSNPQDTLNAYGDIDWTSSSPEWGVVTNASNGDLATDAMLIGNFDYVVSVASSGSSSTLNYLPDQAQASWQASYKSGTKTKYHLYVMPGYSYTSTGAVTLNAIPEPSTLILLGMGACVALLAIKRRK